jgi:hypothetical protein
LDVVVDADAEIARVVKEEAAAVEEAVEEEEETREIRTSGFQSPSLVAW